MVLSIYQRKILEDRNREMLAKYKTGMTTRELAKYYGLTQGGAHYALKQALKVEERELSTN